MAVTVNPFDAGIISFFNRFARHSWAFDQFVVLTSSYLFRVAGIVPLLWWAWFRDGEGKAGKRDVVAFGMIGCLFSLACARILSLALPFRERPLRNPELHFQLPWGQTSHVLIGWSSFPSDHAAVYFTLAGCLYLVSRRAGIFALAYALFVTTLPRVYLGLHYPTDILAGALIGLGMAGLAKIDSVRTTTTGLLMRWHERHPGSFYAVFFLYTLQLATAFDSVREFGDYLFAVGKHAFQLMH
jgi:undecaprenyl-diphosphatase